MKAKTPCPCGSNKPFYRCCGSDYSLDELDYDTLSEAIKSGTEENTLREAEAVAHTVAEHQNTRAIDAFLGLSPNQMSDLLDSPLDSPELATIQSKWYPPTSSALQLFMSLVDHIVGDKIKATGKGNLPIKLCRTLLEEYADTTEASVGLRFSGIRSETDFEELYCLRRIGEEAGIIALEKGVFTLTEKGSALCQPKERAALFHLLLAYYVTGFNWAYRDGYPDFAIIQRAWLFSLYSLSCFGQQWLSSRYYEDLFIQAFPAVLNECEEGTFDSPDEQLRQCYTLRTFHRFACFWGLAKTRQKKGDTSYITESEILAPDIEHLVQFHC